MKNFSRWLQRSMLSILGKYDSHIPERLILRSTDCLLEEGTAVSLKWMSVSGMVYEISMASAAHKHGLHIIIPHRVCFTSGLMINLVFWGFFSSMLFLDGWPPIFLPWAVLQCWRWISLQGTLYRRTYFVNTRGQVTYTVSAQGGPMGKLSCTLIMWAWFIIGVILIGPHSHVCFSLVKVDNERSCLYFQGERWFPVANTTIQHKVCIYDSYEPGKFPDFFPESSMSGLQDASK